MNTGPTTSGEERAEPVPQAKTPRVTIQDVAALSGLSICTVSRALRQLPNVSAQAKARVGDAAAQLGYKASSAASRLAGGNTGSVAIIAPTATAWFFARAVEAAEEVFADSGYDTVLISLRNRPSVQQKLFGDLAALAQRVDGVLLLNIALDEADMAALAESGLAVASIGMHDVPWDNVGIDNAEAARAATNHLLDLGHSDLAILAGSETGAPSLVTAGERRRGFELALAGHGLDGRSGPRARRRLQHRRRPAGHGGARGKPRNAVRDLRRLRRDSLRRAHGTAGARFVSAGKRVHHRNRRSSDELVPGPDHNCPASGRPRRLRGQPAD